MMCLIFLTALLSPVLCNCPCREHPLYYAAFWQDVKQLSLCIQSLHVLSFAAHANWLPSWASPVLACFSLSFSSIGIIHAGKKQQQKKNNTSSMPSCRFHRLFDTDHFSPVVSSFHMSCNGSVFRELHLFLIKLQQVFLPGLFFNRHHSSPAFKYVYKTLTDPQKMSLIFRWYCFEDSLRVCITQHKLAHRFPDNVSVSHC